MKEFKQTEKVFYYRKGFLFYNKCKDKNSEILYYLLYFRFTSIAANIIISKCKRYDSCPKLYTFLPIFGIV